MYNQNVALWWNMLYAPDTFHYSDAIMGVMASQIISLTIVYSTVYSGTDKKTSKLRVTGLCEGNSPVTGEFPTQMASHAENTSIWWHHHKLSTIKTDFHYGHLPRGVFVNGKVIFCQCQHSMSIKKQLTFNTLHFNHSHIILLCGPRDILPKTSWTTA